MKQKKQSNYDKLLDARECGLAVSIIWKDILTDSNADLEKYDSMNDCIECLCPIVTSLGKVRHINKHAVMIMHDIDETYKQCCISIIPLCNIYNVQPLYDEDDIKTFKKGGKKK